MISASAIPRLLVCPGSAHLRQADHASVYADEGNDRHADAEVSADLGQHDDLPPQVQALIEPGDLLATECAFAYDVSDDTARELGHVRGRGYPALRPFEIPGKVDLLIRSPKRAVVVDYKLYLEVDPARSNAQIATYALMVARVYGYLEVTVAIVYLGADWRPADVAILSALDLDVHADRLRGLVASSDHSLHVSKHCKHCHAFHDCPEQRQLAADADGGALAVRVEAMIPFELDEDAADAYELLQRIRTLTSRIQSALYARAADRPIPLRNGKMFGKHAKQGNERLDGDVVYETIKELHGQDVADAAVERSATKKRLEAALKGRCGAAKAVLAAVRKRGGATKAAGTAIEEYTPGPHLVPDDEPAAPAEAESPF